MLGSSTNTSESNDSVTVPFTRSGYGDARLNPTKGCTSGPPPPVASNVTFGSAAGGLPEPDRVNELASIRRVAVAAPVLFGAKITLKDARAPASSFSGSPG